MQLLPRIELKRERADKVQKNKWDDGSSALFRVPDLGNLGKGPATNRGPPIGHGQLYGGPQGPRVQSLTLFGGIQGEGFTYVVIVRELTHCLLPLRTIIF